MSYYLLAGTIITGIGWLCVYETNRIIEIGVNISWEITKMVSSVSEYLGIDTNEENYNFMNDEEYLEGNEDENEMLLKKDTFIKYYNIEKNASYNISYKNKDEIDKNLEDMDVIFLKTINEDGIFYFRLDNLENLEKIKFNKVEKLFLQVELIDKDNSDIIDIHHNLDKFYIEDNKILDTDFLKWYLTYFHKSKLPENYELRIFDKDINMLTLEKNEYIKITDEGYNKL
jgi:hypothetical protein